MPTTPTYPGVYIEEIPSGVRTITGVATSITAFIGFALRGPTNDPIRIQNFGDFERVFGGITANSMMSYAVQQFFLNGGSDALIVRLSSKTRATTVLKAGDKELILEAIEPGRLGDTITATVNHEGVTENTNANLIIKKGGKTETINNVKFDQISNQVGANSSLVRVKSSNITQRPDAVADQKFTGGTTGGAESQISLPTGAASAPPLILNASSEGSWGNKLRALVDQDIDPDKPDRAKLFNLTVQYVDGEQVSTEKLRNLSIDPTSPRYVVDVLKVESTLVRVDPNSPIPSDRPNASGLKDDGSPNYATASDGQDSASLPSNDNLYVGSRTEKTGLYALEKADLFNLLCIPPVRRDVDISTKTWTEALKYCSERRAMLLVDPPIDWTTKDAALKALPGFLSGWSNKKNSALFFPRIKLQDPLKENRLEPFAPCGAIAGIFARTDAARGVWKAPAGIDAAIAGAQELTVKLTDGENGQLNPLGVNCLRFFPVYGNVVWGSRTLDGDDRIASEWKYIPVRRMVLFLEESLYRGTQWVVFEPNDEPLWSQIRLNLGAFMNNLFRQGAFQGKTPKEAYFVKCDSETTTQNDINLGIVNIVVGFAPLKPAEFVIIKFQQMAGQVVT